MYKILFRITVAAIIISIMLILFGCASFKPSIEQRATLIRYQVGQNVTLMELQNECGEWWRLRYYWYQRRMPMKMEIGALYIVTFDTTSCRRDADGKLNCKYKIRKA